MKLVKMSTHKIGFIQVVMFAVIKATIGLIDSMIVEMKNT